jgi:hypothetical protein
VDVGVNYPWFDYGWDFGVPPPHWRPTASPRWLSQIDAHLRHFQRLEVAVVRWFVLADGLTYGRGDAAPRRDPVRESEWRFDAPELNRELLDDFDELLRRFARINAAAVPRIRLLPVLVDFHFCDAGIQPVAKPDPELPGATLPDPAWVKQGRVDAIAHPTIRAMFLDRVLAPLLEVSRSYRDVLYAWELINEPEWVTNGWHPDRRRDHPVEEHEMRTFLDEGQARIRAAGFSPTIGFASIDTLRSSGIASEINQFHYYPGGRGSLDPHQLRGGFPTILGEFATAPSDVWPELTPDAQRVFDRLRLAEERGYSLAIPWSFRASDHHTLWSDADVVRYMMLESDGS